jgi:hypothetical protein
MPTGSPFGRGVPCLWVVVVDVAVVVDWEGVFAGPFEVTTWKRGNWVGGHFVVAIALVGSDSRALGNSRYWVLFSGRRLARIGGVAGHRLPADTRARVARSLSSLTQFPTIGPALAGRWEGYRFILGPWRWLILVYVFIEKEDRVVVVTIQDAH